MRQKSAVVQRIYMQTICGNQPLHHSPRVHTYGMYFPATLALRYSHVPNLGSNLRGVSTNDTEHLQAKSPRGFPAGTLALEDGRAIQWPYCQKESIQPGTAVGDSCCMSNDWTTRGVHYGNSPDQYRKLRNSA